MSGIVINCAEIYQCYAWSRVIALPCQKLTVLWLPQEHFNTSAVLGLCMPALLNKWQFLIVLVFLPQWSPFTGICPLQNWNSPLAKAHSLSFHSSADRPFLGMAESQHTMSQSNACVIDHMQLHAYLIRNRAPHVINNHVHLTRHLEWQKEYNSEAVLHVADSSAWFLCLYE